MTRGDIDPKPERPPRDGVFAWLTKTKGSEYDEGRGSKKKKARIETARGDWHRDYAPHCRIGATIGSFLLPDRHPRFKSRLSRVSYKGHLITRSFPEWSRYVTL